MTTLYIDRKNLELRIESNTLAFYSESERLSTMPLNLIERLCIKGDLQLSAGVLGKLGELGIGIVILAGRKQQATMLLPNAKQDARRRLAQAHYADNSGFCLARAKNWVREKILRQRSHLQTRDAESHIATNTLHHEIEQLRQAVESIASVKSLAQLRGIEGSAASAHFSALSKILPASLNFTGRNRNPPRDPYNVVLSLSYTLLHYDMVRQIHLIGLDPYIGYYHGLLHGRESLACDLIEPLRPLIDEWAIDRFRDRTLRPEDFSTQGETCHMGKAARARYYPAYEIAARQWRKEMRQISVDLLQKLGEAVLQNPQMRIHAEAFQEGPLQTL